jgi:hypothetical protein
MKPLGDVVEIRDAGEPGVGIFARVPAHAWTFIGSDRALASFFHQPNSFSDASSSMCRQILKQHGEGALKWLRSSGFKMRRPLPTGADATVSFISKELDLEKQLVQDVFCTLYEYQYSQRVFASAQPIGAALFPYASLVNHSCDANCLFVSTGDGHCRVLAIRDILPGDQITVPYLMFLGVDGYRQMSILQLHDLLLNQSCLCGTKRCLHAGLSIMPTAVPQQLCWTSYLEDRPKAIVIALKLLVTSATVAPSAVTTTTTTTTTTFVAAQTATTSFTTTKMAASLASEAKFNGNAATEWGKLHELKWAGYEPKNSVESKLTQALMLCSEMVGSGVSQFALAAGTSLEALASVVMPALAKAETSDPETTARLALLEWKLHLAHGQATKAAPPLSCRGVPAKILRTLNLL